MELSPYLDALRRELLAAAAPGGAEVTRTAELLTGALDAAARLCLLEALGDAAAEITSKLDTASVEVRLRGREADFVVTSPVTPSSPPPELPEGGDLARITLRLPEPLKAQVESAAATEGVSVNSWLVRAIASAVNGGPPTQRGRGGLPRRITGFAQA
jgi:HicB-like protein involved in pilus formation